VYRVLFVCTGNICRSPTAEGVFRSLVEARGLEGRISTDSAGTGAWHVGEPPDARSQETARRRGVEIGGLRARTVRPDDFALFDLVVAMDRGHYRALAHACPAEHAERVRLFMDFAANAAMRDVPDPYYGEGDGFERVFDMIESGALGILVEIEANHLR
jgi:protein-tyrosine phosphatase